MSNALKKAKRKSLQKELDAKQADPSSVYYNPKQGSRALTVGDYAHFRRLLKGKHRKIVSELMSEPLENVSKFVDALDVERLGKLWGMVDQISKPKRIAVNKVPAATKNPAESSPGDPSEQVAPLQESVADASQP